MNTYKIIKGDLSGNLTFDIENENLIYTDCVSHHGLQCNYKGDTPQYKEIQTLCDNVIILIKKIEMLNNWDKGKITKTFSELYKLTFVEYSHPVVAQFVLSDNTISLTINQMIDCIANNYMLETVVKEHFCLCPNCYSANISFHFLTDKMICNNCDNKF